MCESVILKENLWYLREEKCSVKVAVETRTGLLAEMWVEMCVGPCTEKALFGYASYAFRSVRKGELTQAGPLFKMAYVQCATQEILQDICHLQQLSVCNQTGCF